MYTLTKCALCGEKQTLRESHIIPKLVIRYLKDTSIGAIRSMDRINRPIQDGEKHKLLCQECEEKLSALETWYANHIFYPYQKKEATCFAYDKRLAEFLISVSWRSIYLDILDYVQSGDSSLEALQCFIESEKIMKEFLLNKRDDLGSIENHLFFFDDVESMSDGLKTESAQIGINTVLHRGVANYTFQNCETQTFGNIANMMGIVLVTLCAKGPQEVWRNTRISIDGGTVEARNQEVRSVVGMEFVFMRDQCESAFANMSDPQKDKVDMKIKAVGSDIRNYRIFADWVNDKRLAVDSRE